MHQVKLDKAVCRWSMDFRTCIASDLSIDRGRNQGNGRVGPWVMSGLDHNVEIKQEVDVKDPW